MDLGASRYITLLDSALRKTLKSRKGSFEWNLVYNLHTYLHYLCSTQVGPFHYQIRNTGAAGARRLNTNSNLKVIITKFHAKNITRLAMQ